MARFRWALAHLLGIAWVLAYAVGAPGGLAPILLAVALPGALELSLRKEEGFAFWTVATLSGALALWQLAAGRHPPLALLPPVAAGLATFAFLSRTRAKTTPWLLALGIEVCLVAYFSAATGGSGPMLRWLLAHGLSDGSAHEITLAFRKTVHFTFYGTVGWTALCAARAAGAGRAEAVRTGLLAALALASFDELRQSGYANRTGSAWDVLLDCAGAATFVGLSEVRRRKVQ